MTYYKLRKDTPTAKAGTKFKASVGGYDSQGLLVRLVPLDQCVKLQWRLRDIDDFDEWFERVSEDSVRWTPGYGEKYWFVNEYGDVDSGVWDGYLSAVKKVYRTEEECEKAQHRDFAESILCQTSNFKPDFENGKGGWVIQYDHATHRLATWRLPFENGGELVRYETKEEAEKSINENKKEWLIYFGVENG